VKYSLLRSICVVGLSLFGSLSFADDASFSFAPAPANLSGDINRNKIGIDVVTVQVEGASDITATTFRYLSKNGKELPDSEKRSVAGLNYYFTAMDSPDFDSAMAFGFGFDGVSGSPSGGAFIFGTGMDLQSFSASTAYSSMDMLSMILHLDVGAQSHIRLGPDTTLVPWGKYSLLYANTTIFLETQVPSVGGGTYTYFDTIDSTSTYGSLSYGLDMLYRGFSLGAMYQQGEKASVAKFSISTDF